MPKHKTQISPRTWSEALPVLILLLDDSDSATKYYVRKELKRMARVADLSLDGGFLGPQAQAKEIYDEDD